jgi:hypothetical protein
MKRLILASLILCLFVGTSFAVDGNWSATPVVAVQGRHGPVKAYTFTDNAAVTLTTAYVTGWVEASTGYAPIGFTISVETNDARYSCGGGTPTATVGHLLAVGAIRELSVVAGDTCRVVPKTAGSYPLIQINPIYSK